MGVSFACVALGQGPNPTNAATTAQVTSAQVTTAPVFTVAPTTVPITAAPTSLPPITVPVTTAGSALKKILIFKKLTGGHKLLKFKLLRNITSSSTIARSTGLALLASCIL